MRDATLDGVVQEVLSTEMAFDLNEMSEKAMQTLEGSTLQAEETARVKFLRCGWLKPSK